MKLLGMARARWLSDFAVLISFCAGFLYADPASTGSWATDTLSNDDASDLLGQLPNRGLETIRDTLNAALSSVSPVGDETASRALAAAEVVAAMMGSPLGSLPATCKEWAMVHSKDASRDLIQLAVRAVDRVIKDSGTQELMQEGGTKNLQDWQISVTNLKARLIGRLQRNEPNQE